MNQLVTIRTFNGSSDLEMVRTYLESFEIECFTKDEIISRADVSNINGGAKLLIREEQLEEAITHLLEGGYLKKEDFEPTPEFKFVDKILSKFRK
ncbi:hypothetical protein SDC9_160900 [bioreactor metagenome]|uniref:Uncharacterized protein n=1 Tax=bioreactor metagenome TaxID=1076179 RepID=A0A645FGQ4_9ZZZZ|nr:DUF2007 domain-containing protein [Paludibacter sp.]